MANLKIRRRAKAAEPTPPKTPSPHGRIRRRRSGGKRKRYFDNALVESLVIEYQRLGCTDLSLRNQIMSHSDELIRQVMRAYNLHNIYPYRDQTAEADLYQAAWSEIERSLYKFDQGRGTKIFNLWTQVARASMLALVKREGRDRKNQGSYRNHLISAKRSSLSLSRFVAEAREVLRDNHDYLRLLECLVEIYETDDKPSDGLIVKLSERSGLTKIKVQKFLGEIRLRAAEFSDSPANEEPPMRRSSHLHKDNDHDDDDHHS